MGLRDKLVSLRDCAGVRSRGEYLGVISDVGTADPRGTRTFDAAGEKRRVHAVDEIARFLNGWWGRLRGQCLCIEYPRTSKNSETREKATGKNVHSESVTVRLSAKPPISSDWTWLLLDKPD